MFELGLIALWMYVGFRALRFWMRTTPTTRVPSKSDIEPTYQTLPRRFLALLLDAGLVYVLNEGLSFLHLGTLTIGVHSGYPVIAVALDGRTFGKLALGLTVQMQDGTRATWRAAILREAPSLTSVALFLLVEGLYGAPSPTLSPEEARRLLGPLRSLMLCVGVLALADVTCALLSRQRRALHDWLAGTVVVRVSAKGSLPSHLPSPVEGSLSN